jgi:alpha-beta hydrolase superfamily lysophospholipase
MLKFVDKYIKDNLQNKPFIIMGHSMGGGITLSTYPKFKEQIAAIILECPLSPAATNRSEENGEYTPTDVSRKTIKRAKHIAKLG